MENIERECFGPPDRSPPLGDGALLLEPEGADAKLPRLLILLLSKQRIAELAQLVGITFALGNVGGLQNGS